jgi:hypothetical protein
MYLKPYSNYKSGFDAIRATNKQKKPTTEQHVETSKINDHKKNSSSIKNQRKHYSKK